VHRAILIVDVEKYGDPARTNAHRLAVREGMYRVLRQSFAKARIDWADCMTEDCGDGVLVLVPPAVPKSWLAARLPVRLAEVLHRYNTGSPPETRIRLRMALHAGEVHADARGVAGTAIIRAFRLIEAPALKSALRASPGVVALIVSDWFYDEVVRHDTVARPWSFRQIRVVVKETVTAAWIRLLEPVSPSHADQRQPYQLAQWEIIGTRDRQRPAAVPENRIYLYRIRDEIPTALDRRIGIITGTIRRVRCADVWVNSENTEMKMSRSEEYSVSGIIRYEGARRDHAGHVTDDLIADELTRKVGGRSPVAAGTAIATGPGELARSHNVRYVIHVAAVHGEPGAGYRQVQDVGRCVTNTLAEADRLPDRSQPVATILFPLLGTGQGGGYLDETVQALLGAAADYLTGVPQTQITTVYFLAHTYAELAACQEALDGSPRFALTGP
jgi:O-acetyl-ADP-ribose deacetylase (regulator of RNase III)